MTLRPEPIDEDHRQFRVWDSTYPTRGDAQCGVLFLVGIAFLAVALFTTAHQVTLYGHLFGVWLVIGVYALSTATANFWFTARTAIAYDDMSVTFVRGTQRLDIARGELVSIRLLIFLDVQRSLPMIVKSRRGSVLYKLPREGAAELFAQLERGSPEAHVTTPLPVGARRR
jgi:hypothetical protein